MKPICYYCNSPGAVPRAREGHLCQLPIDLDNRTKCRSQWQDAGKNWYWGTHAHVSSPGANPPSKGGYHRISMAMV
eukprot:4563793-Heterocapsa_arctica.AAC.1